MHDQRSGCRGWSSPHGAETEVRKHSLTTKAAQIGHGTMPIPYQARSRLWLEPLEDRLAACAAGLPCPMGLTVPDVALPELRFPLPTLALLPATLHFEPLKVNFTTQQPPPGADCQAISSLGTLTIALEVVLGGAVLELPLAWSTTVATVTLYGMPPSRLVWYSPGFLVTSPWPTACATPITSSPSPARF
jgi:hypothetical protein